MGADEVCDSAGFASQEFLEVKGVHAATVGSATYDIDELVHETVCLPVGQPGQA